MSMIGGYDKIINTDRVEAVTELALRLLRLNWENCCIENAVTGENLEDDPFLFQQLPEELLVYKNQTAKDSWAEHGAHPKNINSMIHILRGKSSVTIVIDAPDDSHFNSFFEALREYVQQDIFLMKAEAA